MSTVRKYIVVDAPSRLPLNGNQYTIQKYTYQKEIVSEINDIKELPEVTFPIILKAKYKYSKYHKGYFCGGSNIDLKLVTCKDKIVISKKLQSYVLHSYYTYLIHLGMDRTQAMICQHLY